MGKPCNGKGQACQGVQIICMWHKLEALAG